MANGIAVFGVLTFFFLVTLSELRVKFVIRFGRFFKKLRGRMKMLERDPYFQLAIIYKRA
jgi:hypothetical protein